MSKENNLGLMICFKCGRELEELGGILLSPPENKMVEIQVVQKRHICKKCYEILLL